jgi:hypothetical protein
MSHLNEIRETYFHHMKFAWTVAFVLIVHGVLPNVWTDKASDMMEEWEKKHQ